MNMKFNIRIIGILMTRFGVKNVKGGRLTLNIPRGVLIGPPLVCYWLTSVEINKHKIFDTNNA